jgi:hypothetical protein
VGLLAERHDQLQVIGALRRDLGKSGVRAAFVLVLSLLALAPIASASDESALRAEAAAHHQWHALIHSRAGVPQIRDPEFLLSAAAFSPRAELEASLTRLKADPAAACRFPARATWLAQRGLLPPVSLQHCPDVVEFRQRAPIDRVELVFASESITSPASMLGHIFLKISGNLADGGRTEHAISFFTDAETWNYPKLLFDSLVIGKRGYFALAPFETAMRQYLVEEQRTVWLVPLRFTPAQTEVFGLHLLELKNTRLTYFFQDYNCATLVHFLLSVGDRPLPDYSQWMTPKDIVRQVTEADMADASGVAMPSRVLARLIASDADVAGLADAVLNNRLDEWRPTADGRGYLQWSFAQSFNRLAREERRISADAAQRNEAALRPWAASQFAGYAISPDLRFEPARAPQETQWLVEAGRRGGRAGVDVTFRPVSHELDDDNRSYVAETEMQLLTPTLRLEDGGRASLDRFVVYAMRSLQPHDALLGGFSARFDMRWDSQWSARSGRRALFLVSGGAGRTWRLTPDLDVYALANVGAGARSSEVFAYGGVDVGAIVRAVWDTKLHLTATRAYNEANSGRATDRVSLVLSHYLRKDLTVRVRASLQRQDAQRERQAQLGLVWMY